MKKRIGSLLLCLSILTSMAGLTGVLPTAAEVVVTQLNTENADRAIAVADNLLTTAAHTGYNAERPKRILPAATGQKYWTDR